MVEPVAPTWTEPAKPTRMYYVTPTADNPITIPMTQTIMRFAGNTVTINVAVDDNIDWKFTLSKWIVKE